MQYKGIDITNINLTTRDLMRHASENAHDKPFLVYIPRNTTETFGEFEANVNRISNLLVTQYNVKKGDKICTMAENIPELIHTVMAITNIGAVWVPINVMLMGESLRYIIDASDAAFVCVSQNYRKAVAGVLESMEKPARILPLLNLGEMAGEMPDSFDSAIHPDDNSMIIFTSGTTGFPKGVMHTHNTYIRTAVRGLEALETDSSDKIHMYLPFFHGWAYLLMLGALYHQCELVMEDRFHVDKYWDTIKKYKITQDHWTGTVPLNLMKLPMNDFEGTIDLKVLGTFGALYDSMKERWPTISFQSLYGQTEHPFITEVPRDQILPGSDGIPKYPDEILILDNDGNPVPRGDTGEIVCRCRCGVVMKGYYKNDEATAGTLKGTDLYTGDLGRFDENGHLQFVGRKKDALRVRGEMVSVEHIEHLINTHQDVFESAIVGYRPPEKEALKEDEIVAHIVLKNGATVSPDDFNAWSQKNLARFMRPRYLAVSDALPKTATERVQRFKLKEKELEGTVKLF